MVSGYNGLVHQLFKQLQSTFGVLVILFSFSGHFDGYHNYH